MRVRAKDMEVDMRFRLGPCEPEYTVVSVTRYHDGSILIRGMAHPPDGEQAPDGTELFATGAYDEYEVYNTVCKACREFFARFRCNAPNLGECDCPKCQGYCKCELGKEE